jgi:hypothetical protein
MVRRVHEGTVVCFIMVPSRVQQVPTPYTPAEFLRNSPRTSPRLEDLKANSDVSILPLEVVSMVTVVATSICVLTKVQGGKPNRCANIFFRAHASMGITAVSNMHIALPQGKGLLLKRKLWKCRYGAYF